MFCGLSPIRVGVSRSSISLRVHVARKPRTAVHRVSVDNGSQICRGIIHHRLHIGPKSLFDGRTLRHSCQRVNSVKRFSPRRVGPKVRPSPASKAISVS